MVQTLEIKTQCKVGGPEIRWPRDARGGDANALLEVFGVDGGYACVPSSLLPLAVDFEVDNPRHVGMPYAETLWV